MPHPLAHGAQSACVSAPHAPHLSCSRALQNVADAVADAGRARVRQEPGLRTADAARVATQVREAIVEPDDGVQGEASPDRALALLQGLSPTERAVLEETWERVVGRVGERWRERLQPVLEELSLGAMGPGPTGVPVAGPGPPPDA